MEEKKTRRNKRILIISAMLVLLIALLCFGGTTFAKYITSQNVPVKSATVAKWGFVVNANGENLFKEAYQNGSTTVTNGSEDVKVVGRAEGTNLVAPGTKGEVTFSIFGSASEVLAKVGAKINAENLKDVMLKEDTKEYHPIKWTLSKKGDRGAYAAVSGFEALQYSAFVTAFNNKFADKYLEPGASYPEVGEYKIEWEWKFEVEDDTATNDVNEKDDANAKDTILGDVATDVDRTEADKKWTASTDSTTGITTYTSKAIPTTTATIEVAFDLTVGAEQVQRQDVPNGTTTVPASSNP